MRLIQVAKEFRVGLNTLVNFLRNEGAEIDGSPNAIISSDVYALIRRRFGSNERIILGRREFDRAINNDKMVFFKIEQVLHNRIYKDNAVDVRLAPLDTTTIDQILARLKQCISLNILRKFKYIGRDRQIKLLGRFIYYQIQNISSDNDYSCAEGLLKYYKNICKTEEWQLFLKQLPYNKHTYRLWITNIIDSLFSSQESLFDFVLSSDNPRSVITELTNKGKLNPTERIEFILQYYERFEINSEQDLNWAHWEMRNVDELRLPIPIRLLRWIQSEEISGFDERFLSLVYLLPKPEQHNFFRKLIENYRLGLCTLTTKQLLQIVGERVHVDISLRIVVEALCKYKKENRLLSDRELFEIIIGNDRKSESQVNELFAQMSSCTLFNRCEKEYIGNNEVPYLKSGFRLKLLSPRAGISKADIKLENGERYEKRRDYAPEVPFCEGKVSDKLHRITNTPYHWCLGQSYIDCPGIARNEDYKRYTLYDFASILRLNIDIKQLAEFYAQLNWFCLHYKNLICRGCGYTIEPTEQNHNNAHRLTYFNCDNPQCDEYHKSIYINHCFQSNCNGIIDSRDAKRCPNGFVICRKCGSCCAESQFVRKNQAGMELGGHASRLSIESRFHLNKDEFYCPDCGSLLIDDAIDYNGETIKVKKCPNHPNYVGVFPRVMHTKENNKIGYILRKRTVNK